MQKDKRDKTFKIFYDYDDDDDGGRADADDDDDDDADADDDDGDGDVYFSASKDVCGWVMSAEKEEHHQKRLQRRLLLHFLHLFFWDIVRMMKGGGCQHFIYFHNF